MNKNQLKTICKKLNIMPRELPQRVYGGLLHKMWYLESNDFKFAVKQLNRRNQLTEKVRLQYELTEEIAYQFSLRNIPAVHAIKTENNYLIFSENEAFLVYPWITAKALDKDIVSEIHAVKIATILARIHRINLNIPELNSQEFDVHSNEKIVSIIDKSISQNLIFKEQLKEYQLLLIEINELYQHNIERAFSSDEEQQDIGIEQVLQTLPTIFQIKESSAELIQLITHEF